MSPRGWIEPAKLRWEATRLPIELAAGHVHVWAWTFDSETGSEQADLRLLSEFEQKRAARYHFAADQVRYSRCHANMRRILASYLQRDPESLQFREGGGGKPYLENGHSEKDLFFNLSHSRTVALLAVAEGMEIGADVEDIRPIEAAVAERFFSPAEVENLNGLSGPEWLAGFYRCWTRKESILKAEGEGLRIPLNSFDVSLLAGEDAQLLASRPEARLTSTWRLHHLTPAASAIGALAVPVPSVEVDCFRFAPGLSDASER